jgi:hypothetical protein
MFGQVVLGDTIYSFYEEEDAASNNDTDDSAQLKSVAVQKQETGQAAKPSHESSLPEETHR